MTDFIIKVASRFYPPDLSVRNYSLFIKTALT